MNNIILEDEASTPLTEEEKEGLKLHWIATRSELNAAEQQGIQKSERWAWDRKHKNILTEEFIRKLHKYMFGSVWRWAGQFRNSKRNIGVDPIQISSELRKLLDDTKYWIENKTFTQDEIAIRFHQRFEKIHPFPNGNGRHGRLFADLLVEFLGGERFSWGDKNLTSTNSEQRKAYINAIKSADNGQYELLINFARS